MLTANDHQGKFGGDRNVLTLDSGDGWTTVYICKNKDNREVSFFIWGTLRECGSGLGPEEWEQSRLWKGRGAGIKGVKEPSKMRTRGSW